MAIDKFLAAVYYREKSCPNSRHRDSPRSHKLVFAIRRSLTSCHHDMPQGGEAICTN